MFPFIVRFSNLPPQPLEATRVLQLLKAEEAGDLPIL